MFIKEGDGNYVEAVTTDEWLTSSGMKAKSSIRWAQYDPPFAIPFLKRNEAQFDIN